MDDIKIHDCHNNNTIFNTKKWIEYTDEVKQALEREIARKVDFKATDCEIFCPSCREYIRDNEWYGEYIGEDENYCKICGQKLLWK